MQLEEENEQIDYGRLIKKVLVGEKYYEKILH
jgi:hypothetical protein